MQVDQAERRVRRVGNRGERITDDDEPGGRHAALVNDIEDEFQRVRIGLRARAPRASRTWYGSFVDARSTTAPTPIREAEPCRVGVPERRTGEPEGSPGRPANEQVRAMREKSRRGGRAPLYSVTPIPGRSISCDMRRVHQG